MTKLCALMRIIIFCVSVILISFSASGRNVTVRGVVRDSLTREPIPYASVLLKGTDRGVLTDDNGRYTIVTTLPFDSVMASSLGYTTKLSPQGRGATMCRLTLIRCRPVCCSER